MKIYQPKSISLLYKRYAYQKSEDGYDISLLTSYEGEPVGLSVDGASVGGPLGLREGLAVGLAVTGDDEGLAVGFEVTGDTLGETVGLEVVG